MAEESYCSQRQSKGEAVINDEFSQNDFLDADNLLETFNDCLDYSNEKAVFLACLKEAATTAINLGYSKTFAADVFKLVIKESWQELFAELQKEKL